MKSSPIKPPTQEAPAAGGMSKETPNRENTDELFARTTEELVRFGREKRRERGLRRQVLWAALIGGIVVVVGLLVYLGLGLR